ncbi:MAG: flagellar hook-basal body complex protein FliE [Spirochaetes bacterium GWB1_66_5]|nr:MAG: flagellar hook-basal body complex protein FliE [Spirochaetes bacterium GWB1_66_5]
MDLLSAAQAYGHRIALRTSDPRHIAAGKLAAPGNGLLESRATSTATPAQQAEGSFGSMFLQALGQVNQQQLRAQDLSQALISDPESVDIHDVTVALAEANLSLSMAKAVIDRAIRAYREIVNIR